MSIKDKSSFLRKYGGVKHISANILVDISVSLIPNATMKVVVGFGLIPLMLVLDLRC